MASVARRFAESATRGSSSAASVRRSQVVVRASTTLPSEFKVVKPVGDRVFLKVDKEEGQSAGGVLLPTSAQVRPNAGKVLAVGDVEQVKAGDKVVFAQFGGTELRVNDAEHVLIKEDDLIGTLPPSDKISELKPLGDRVVIQLSKSASKTKGGILLNESAEKPNMGTVVAVGPGKKDEDGKVQAPKISAGSLVMFSKYSGVEFSEGDDNEYIIVRENDILGILA